MFTFRPWRPAKSSLGQRRQFFLSFTIKTMVGVCAGEAAVTGALNTINTMVGSTAGAATVNGILRVIVPMAGASAGSASVSGSLGIVNAMIGVAAGAATVEGVPANITSRQVLRDPVDCVLAGQQVSYRPGRAMGRALRRAFNE